MPSSGSAALRRLQNEIGAFESLRLFVATDASQPWAGSWFLASDEAVSRADARAVRVLRRVASFVDWPSYLARQKESLASPLPR